MGKNKGKNKGGKAQQQFKPSTPVQKITAEVKENTASVEAKLSELEEGNVTPVEVKEELSPESATKLEQAEKKEDVAGYLKYLRELNLRIDAQLARANLIVEEAKTEKESLAEEKKEFENEQKQFRTDRAELEKKDIALKKRAQELENGEYSEIIHTLLESLEESQAKVLEGTKERIEAISALHIKTMDAIQANQEELSKLEEEKSSIQKQMRDLKREKTKFDVEKTSLKSDLEEEFQAQYQAKMVSLEDELARMKSKNSRLEKESEELKTNLEKIRSAFDYQSPEEMVQLITSYKEKVERLTKERDGRPSQRAYDDKCDAVSLLEKRVSELEAQVSEEYLGELRVKLANLDNFSFERMALKKESEAKDIKIKYYEWRHKSDQELIELLQTDKTKSDKVFEFAKAADHDPKYTQVTFARNEIANLPSLVSYIQGRMIASRQDNGKSKPFYYDNKTIRVFLAGLHMSPISILQGISGTGKTSLPIEFAKALIADERYSGKNEGDQEPNAPYRICSVQSGWRDNMDLMGYHNSFDHKYKETECFKALYLANLPKYKDTLFFIILDEMNLSRPEHYFAEFLSRLELSEGGRSIPISVDGIPAEAYPDKIVGKQLCIPKNVRFIGTANHDETTLEFAPKTYDRSNLMEMPKNISHEGKSVEAKYNISYSWLEEQFEDAMGKYKEECAKFNEFITNKDFTNLLRKLNIGVGNRFEKQADRFISVFLASGNNTKEDLAVAADHLITSRLFRTLKDNIFLTTGFLESFKSDYETLFVLAFEGEEPKEAIQLLEDEITKKERESIDTDNSNK